MLGRVTWRGWSVDPRPAGRRGPRHPRLQAAAAAAAAAAAPVSVGDA